MLLLSPELGHRTIDDWKSGPSFTGSFDVMFHLDYHGGQAIKYCIISCVPVNAVGDIVACTMTNAIERRLEITGPINPGSDVYGFKNVWYNPTIAKVNITKVEILYMDGSSESISGQKMVEDMRRWQQQKQQEQQLKEQQRWRNMNAFNRWAYTHPFLFVLFMIGEFLLLGLLAWLVVTFFV